ncbi:Uncharacterised protein [Yersinia similis]|uniref:Uncharacterized protein n=1 Tax=Yersinia similis TaxID=367190 RepID=A0A0T9QUT0_9GAMM|nr:Uncharacterised protein [Yersinia similis]CNI29621.1 Uncharacterised protein [Yersinia similis]
MLSREDFYVIKQMCRQGAYILTVQEHVIEFCQPSEALFCSALLRFIFTDHRMRLTSLSQISLQQQLLPGQK